MAVNTFESSETQTAISALLVEDDDLDALVLTTYAHMDPSISVEVTRAHSLAEAYDLVRTGHYDMYFVDLHVGGGTSLRLLSDLERKGARAVVLSNASALEVSRYGLDRGGLVFLAKPECSAARIGELMREAAAARDSALP